MAHTGNRSLLSHGSCLARGQTVPAHLQALPADTPGATLQVHAAPPALRSLPQLRHCPRQGRAGIQSGHWWPQACVSQVLAHRSLSHSNLMCPSGPGRPHQQRCWFKPGTHTHQPYQKSRDPTHKSLGTVRIGVSGLKQCPNTSGKPGTPFIKSKQTPSTGTSQGHMLGRH